jgi:hypothetical protein
MLVLASREACNSICTVAKSSIDCSSHPIPSVEFSPTNSPEDEGKLFIHSNPLEQVHIVYMSVTKLSLAERLILLHLLGATDGNIVVIHGHRNVIVFKIADRPPVSCGEGTKDKGCVESCDPSLECELEPRLDEPDENTHFTPPINFFIMHSTCNKTHNNKYLAPYVFALALAERVEGNKGLCREITSDDASKKTSLLQH